MSRMLHSERTEGRVQGQTPAGELRLRRAGLCVALPLSAMLSGCQAVVSSPTASQVRIIDASPDAPGLDMYENNSVIAYNLGFGTVTSYISTDPGTFTVSANIAGSKTALATAKGTFTASSQYTVLIGNSAANLQELILKDQAQAAPSGQVSLRIIDQATRVGAVDVYLVPAGQKFTAVTPVLTNVSFATNTGYINVPTGSYTLVIVPAGTIPTSSTVATYIGAQVNYTGGSVTTIVLIDQQLVTTPGLQVVTAQDYVSPTATS